MKRQKAKGGKRKAGLVPIDGATGKRVPLRVLRKMANVKANDEE